MSWVSEVLRLKIKFTVYGKGKQHILRYVRFSGCEQITGGNGHNESREFPSQFLAVLTPEEL